MKVRNRRHLSIFVQSTKRRERIFSCSQVRTRNEKEQSEQSSSAACSAGECRKQTDDCDSLLTD